jgi:hypothetical protein
MGDESNILEADGSPLEEIKPCSEAVEATFSVKFDKSGSWLKDIDSVGSSGLPTEWSGTGSELFIDV